VRGGSGMVQTSKQSSLALSKGPLCYLHSSAERFGPGAEIDAMQPTRFRRVCGVRARRPRSASHGIDCPAGLRGPCVDPVFRDRMLLERGSDKAGNPCPVIISGSPCTPTFCTFNHSKNISLYPWLRIDRYCCVKGDPVSYAIQ